MENSETPSGSRIAIKFSKPASNGANQTLRAPPQSSLGKRPRPNRVLNGDDDSEPEVEAHTYGKPERLLILGDASVKSGRPLSVQKKPNRDWKAEAKARQRGQNPGSKEVERLRHNASGGTGQQDTDEPQQWGLVTKKQKDNTAKDVLGMSGVSTDTPKPLPKDHDSRENLHDPDPDQEAVDALLGRTSASSKGPDRVIASSESTFEVNTFKSDFRNAADESTEKDYEEMPVEEFGAAMLRGMGWNGKSADKKSLDVKRRPNLLGLGAKHLKGEEDLGAWNQKRPKLLDYSHDEDKRKQSRDSQRHESYKEERDRERNNKDREIASSRHRHRDRHHHR